jgi:hypothetical protein
MNKTSGLALGTAKMTVRTPFKFVRARVGGTPVFGSAGSAGLMAYTLKFSSPPESWTYKMNLESRLQK